MKRGLCEPVHMDRMTKATLWVAFLVLGAYFVWLFLDCAMDDTCHLGCPSNYGIMLSRGANGCGLQRTPKAIDDGRPARDY
jgi:hypothetical protein